MLRTDLAFLASFSMFLLFPRDETANRIDTNIRQTLGLTAAQEYGQNQRQILFLGSRITNKEEKQAAFVAHRAFYLLHHCTKSVQTLCQCWFDAWCSCQNRSWTAPQLHHTAPQLHHRLHQDFIQLNQILI